MNYTVYKAVDLLFGFIELVIIARVIVSWLPISRSGQLIRILYTLTEPILAPIRAMLERSSLGKYMMVDFSPIIAFILLRVIETVILRILYPGPIYF
jgi:YggT family protein